MRHTIVITGAGGGLGRGLALCLAQQGHFILATDLHLTLAIETANHIRDQGGRADAYALDVSSESNVQQFWSDIAQQRVTMLINNAGLQKVAKIEEFSIEDWNVLIAVMLKGPFLMIRAALPGMRRWGFGRIINIGSIHSLVASPYKAAYVAAKHAVIGLSKTIALEMCDVDITCNTICPAYIQTPLVDSQIKAQAEARSISEDEVIDRIMLKPMPKKCFITFSEIAAAVEYLGSSAARNVTGQALTIDGGWTSQ